MKLETLLSYHNETTPETLNSFGDNYLLKNNPVFKKVRSYTLEIGFSFTENISSDYISFPMGQLENILKNKTIPYANNLQALKNLTELQIKSLTWSHLADNLKPNYVLHESCHAIARSFRPRTNDFNTGILLTLLEESFANTCEFLAIAFAQNQTHRIFLEMNSYFNMYEDQSLLKKSIDRYGLNGIFKFLMLSYLHSNFLNEKMSDKVFKNICSLSQFSASLDLKNLRTLGQNAFALNQNFRYTTTEMYLLLNEVQMSVNEALAFDYLNILNTNTQITSVLDQLAMILQERHT